MTTETEKLKCADCGQTDGWLNDVRTRLVDQAGIKTPQEVPLCNFCRRERQVDAMRRTRLSR